MVRKSFDSSSINEDIDVVTSPSKNPQLSKNKSTGCYIHWYTAMFGLMAVAVAIHKSFPTTSSTFTCDFGRLKDTHSTKNDIIWKALRMDTYAVVNDTDSDKPHVYLLAYLEESAVATLIDDIVQTTRSCLQIATEPLILFPEDFATSEMQKDYGIAIDTFRERLTASRIMLVTDVNKVNFTTRNNFTQPYTVVQSTFQISPYVAQAFHTICDTITPFVKRSIIFMTMSVTTKQDTPSLLVQVQAKLNDAWSGLGDNIRHPLITRVTDQVFLLNTN